MKAAKHCEAIFTELYCVFIFVANKAKSWFYLDDFAVIENGTMSADIIHFSN